MTVAEAAVGRRYGYLLVLAPVLGPRLPTVSCRCDCGTISTHRVAHLRTGRAQSCGCRGGTRRKHPTVTLGMRFGRWTVTTPIVRVNGARFVECRCDCGTVRRVRVGLLLSGESRSCYCARRGQSRQGKYPKGITSRSPEYRVWRNMQERCYRPTCSSYASYGGQGIAVCDRWRGPDGFFNFIADVGRRPAANYHLDRIDSTRGYEPLNTRWLPAADNLSRSRPRRHKAVCKHGHPMSAENVRIGSKGKRVCRACHRERAARIRR